MHEIPDSPLNTSLGISRRTLVRRSLIAGGVLVWGTPVIRALAGPSSSAGTVIGDLSFVAATLAVDNTTVLSRWDVADHRLVARHGSDAEVPRSIRLATVGAVSNTAPDVAATVNADGSISLDLGERYRLVDFVVGRGRCHAGPGEHGQPVRGQVGGFVTFPPLPDDACA